ncbi:MAG TPA: hypothetical protein VNG53_08520 [Bacteroidia bacterium]|nr:hypothetical protein [Bacteroidia bacterium]
MSDSFLITEENLIGTIASAILQLKKIKEQKESTFETKFLIKLIDFIEKTNRENYLELLYDKYFIISKKVLENLHQEFNEINILVKIDFEIIKKYLTKTSFERNTTEELMEKLKEIAMILLQIRSQRQVHM